MKGGQYKFVRTEDIRKQETVKGVYSSRVDRKGEENSNRDED
jgi:hypothetical protein